MADDGRSRTSSSSSSRLVTLFLSILVSLMSCRLELSSTTILANAQALKTFGEPCEGDCDERQLLTCSQNTSICQCMRPNTMVYDQNSLRCVGLAGEACVRYANEFSCAAHANCKDSSLCSCNKGYFQTENGTCVLVAKYGDVCSSKRPCDKESGMQCTGSSSGSGRSRRTCQCIFPSDQYYNSTAKMCISYGSGNCTGGTCVQNAECSVDIYELRKGENIYGKAYNYNVTVGQKCKCKEGFKETKERQCLASYLQPCNGGSGRGCNPEENLICFDSSICLCKSPLTQIYDWKMLKCKSLEGAKCNEGGGGDAVDNSPCVSNAECNADVADGKCVCRSGFTSTPFSTCLKDFGTECRSSGGSSCNYWRGLSCHQKSGTCGCIDASLKYDTNAKICESVEGGPCGTFEFSDSLGFVRGGNRNGGVETTGVGVTMMMANHKRGIMLAGTGGNTNSSSTSPTSGGGSGIIGGKTFQSLIKIHIKCGSEFECVNAFGEMRNGGNEHVFHGFCRRKV